MPRRHLLTFCLLTKALAQTSTETPPLSQLLGFELPATNGVPSGWVGAPSETVRADESVVHGGRASGRIERTSVSSDEFSRLGCSVPVTFSGSQLELRGFLKTSDVIGFAALVLRQEERSSLVSIASMERKQPVTGTTAWQEYSLRVPLDPSADHLMIYVVLHGRGTVWADDLRLFIDGKQIMNQSKPKRLSDREFDNGSSIQLQDLTPLQVENLATLCQVWGFLKYYHPDVASGQFQWDYELLRAIREVIKAGSREEAHQILVAWINGLGTLTPCDPCAGIDSHNLRLSPALDLMYDRTLLGPILSRRLQQVYDARALHPSQFYVAADLSGRLSFREERDYPTITFPDAGFQILALFRFWNIVKYWSAYRNFDPGWGQVLADFIPRVALARDSASFRVALAEVVAHVRDSNARVWNAFESIPPTGECRVPAGLRFTEDGLVVTADIHTTRFASVLNGGDVVLAIDGRSVPELGETLRKTYGASNETAQQRLIAANITRGACGSSANLKVLTARGTRDLQVSRMPLEPSGTIGVPQTSSFRMVTSNVAYVNLSTLAASDVDAFFAALANVHGLIIDARGASASDAALKLAQHLIDRPSEYGYISTADLSHPGVFRWSGAGQLLPIGPKYNGKVLVLIDETTEGPTEYATMALRRREGVKLVGLPTAGKPGPMIQIILPGGVLTSISDIAVFDSVSPGLRQEGLAPDIPVRLNLEELRANNDQMLAFAAREIE